MNLDNYNILKGIVKELRRELTELENEIQYNLRCMKEADIYVHSFLDEESADFKVFSPRNNENVHKNEIERTYQERDGYEEKNRYLNSKKEILCKRIEQLENILHRRELDLTVLNMQEEDRQRIARDLHDTSLQNLAHLVHKIELSSLYIDKDPVKAKLELSVVSKILKETIDEIRNTIFDLRPMTFDDLGLKAAFQRLLSEINESKKYTVTSDIDDVSCENNLVLVSVYRIVQECLNNIVKDAEAEEIFFSCKNQNGNCVINIKDNGKGFNPDGSIEGKHFGLSLMKERVYFLSGRIEIFSEPGKGTEIHLEIPLDLYKSFDN